MQDLLRILTGIVVGALMSGTAAAEDTPVEEADPGPSTYIGAYGVGATSSFVLNPGSLGTETGGVFATLMVRRLVQLHDGHPLLDVMGSVQANMFGGGSRGAWAGVMGGGHIMVGGQLHDAGTSGCSPYFGVNAGFEGEGGWRTDTASYYTRILPESGLLCEVGDALFTLTPAVGVGHGWSYYPGHWTSEEEPTVRVGRTDFLQMSAIGRLVVNEDFYGYFEGVFSPQVIESYFSSEGWRATIDLTWRFLRDPGLLLNLGGRLQRWQNSIMRVDGVGEARSLGITDVRGWVAIAYVF